MHCNTDHDLILIYKVFAIAGFAHLMLFQDYYLCRLSIFCAENPHNFFMVLKSKLNRVKSQNTFARFLKEEKAQGAIEYILLAGGIIVAAVVVYGIYSNMVTSAGKSLNESVGTKVGEMSDILAAQNLSI